MSQENVEIVRQMYDEWAEGRLGAGLHLFHPDVVYTRQGGGMGIGMTLECRGVGELVRASGEWIETFEFLRVRAERFIDCGDAVLVFTRHSGNAKVSGLPIEAECGDVLTFRDGLVVRFDQYRTRSGALEAVGLRE
jgi:ketosteroid isomerase-like protein